MNQNRLTLNITRICTGLIAILPVIQVYKFPFTDMSCATIFILLFLPVFMLKLTEGILKQNKKILGTIPLLLYCVWGMSKCAGSPIDFILFVVVYVYIAAIVVSNIFNVNRARKIVENIAVISSIIVMMQHILYYIFGLSLKVVVIKAWVMDYVLNSLTSPIGLFRPSAIFAEPAHFTQYAIIGLVSILLFNLESKINIKKAVIITLGILMTTSGIGIVLTLISWGLWLYKRSPKEKFGKHFFKIFSGLTAGTLVCFVLMQFGFFASAVERIFGEVDGYNAISGRLFWWDTYFSDLLMHDLLWGFGYSTLPPAYFTGFMKIIYATGIIGFILLTMAIFKCIFNTKGFSFCLSIMYYGLLFVANITGFILMIYWFSFMHSGFIWKDKLIKATKREATCRLDEY